MVEKQRRHLETLDYLRWIVNFFGNKTDDSDAVVRYFFCIT
jgi:hypothetical protein